MLCVARSSVAYSCVRWEEPRNRRATPKWRRLTANRDEGISSYFFWLSERASRFVSSRRHSSFSTVNGIFLYPLEFAFFPSFWHAENVTKCRNKGANFDVKYFIDQCTPHNIGIKYTSRSWWRRRRRTNDKCTHSRTQYAPMLWCCMNDMNEPTNTRIE